MEEKRRKRQIIKISIFITSIFVIFMSVTYGFINLTLTGNKKQIITAGNLKLKLDEKEEIDITNALPMYDEVGLIQEKAFTFELVNETKTPTNYILSLEETETSKSNVSKLETNIVKYGLTKEGLTTKNRLSDVEKNNYQIDQGVIRGNKTIHYSLRFWIDSSVTENDKIKGKSLSYLIKIEGSQTGIEEETKDANAPVLAKNMIPVIYDAGEEDGTGKWVVANTNEEWYNYEEQKWANAVTVTENSRSNYINAETGEINEVGKEVSMDDINTMWVWIPRYSYSIKSEDNGKNYYGKKIEGNDNPTKELPGEIDVHFIDKNTTEYGLAQYTDNINGTWRTPDAFTFGGKNLPGIWVGKFELGGTLSDACTNETCDTSKLTIKPGETSLREQTVSSFFYAIRNMQNEGNPFGFDAASQNTMDIHMIKNSEWGAVAYLSQSKYGKYGNSTYKTSEDKQVRINNCSTYKTGIGASTQNAKETTDICESQENQYDGTYGQAASTTGNITGIYDMSGGAYEYVMGVLADDQGIPRSGQSTTSNSGFKGKLNDDTEYSDGINLPNAKYYDLYTNTNSSIACNSGVCYGHVLSETSEWYNDKGNFLSSSSPWFLRGGSYAYTSNAGVFNFRSNDGDAYSDYSSRATLIPIPNN